MKRNDPTILQCPWLITHEGFLSIMERARAGGWPGENNTPDDDDEDNGLLSVDDGVGIISINGPLMRKPDMWDRFFGGVTAFDDIHSALATALSRDDIRSILLDIDSPGGTVNGTPELALAVAEATKSKPVYSFTSGLMASAVYWVGSQANAVFATPSARVGSVGVLLPLIDSSKFMDDLGFKVDMIKSGVHKGAGFPGTTLTDEQRELLQTQVDEIHDEFKSAVLARGRKIPMEAMEGQVFSGRNAQRHNLAGMVNSRADVLAKMRGLNRARVDTGSRANMKTLDEQLAEANAETARLNQEVSKLKTEAETREALMGESSDKIKFLADEKAKLTADLAEVNKAKAGLETKVTELTGNLTKAEARVKDLESAEQDLEKRASLKAAEIAASMGSKSPLPVSGAPEQTGTTAEVLKARFDACTSPAQQTAFWRSLTPDQQSLLASAK